LFYPLADTLGAGREYQNRPSQLPVERRYQEWAGCRDNPRVVLSTEHVILFALLDGVHQLLKGTSFLDER
jgi:hypothetical protein